MIEQTVIIILTGVTAVAALLAAIGACWSAIVTKWTAQGQLFASLLRDYSSKDMLDALKRLRYLSDKKDTGYDFASWLDQWKQLRKSIETGNPQVIDDARCIDEARRLVSHHFLTALQLYENKKCIDEHFLEEICAADGFDLLYEIVEDLEYVVTKSIGKKYDPEKFDRLLALSCRSDKARLQRFRPKN